MRKLATALLGLVLAATGVYFVLYLYGWEWYRALVVGIVFLSAELALVSIHLHAGITRITRITPDHGPAVEHRPQPAFRHDLDGRQVVAGVLDASPVSHPDPFRWLRPQNGRAPVFIPLLLGAGVLMSGVAWVTERLATLLYGSRIDASLARMAAPLVPPDDLLDRPTAPGLLASPGSWDRVTDGSWNQLVPVRQGR